MESKITYIAVFFAIIMFLLVSPTAQASVLSFPASTQNIEEEAFINDTSIESVELPEGIRYIKSKAFANSSLKAINLPETLVDIADDAFAGCNSLVATVAEETYSWNWCVKNGVAISTLVMEYPESEHPYEPNTDQSWTYRINDAVDYLQVTFSTLTQTEQDYDFIYLYDKENNLVGTYSGSQLAGKTVTIEGSSFRIRLTSDDEECLYGFLIEKIEGFVRIPLTISAIPNKIEADLNESIIWTTTVTGGSSPYTYSYYLYQDEVLLAESTNQTRTSYTKKLTSRGNYVLEVTVSDSQGYTATASAEPVVVDPLTITNILPDAEWVKKGNVIEWTVEAIGGTKPYSYDFDIYRGENLAVNGQTTDNPVCTYTVKKSNSRLLSL